MPAPTFLFWFFPFTWGLGAMLFVPYFLPSIIALIRRSHSTAGVFVLNFFLGWTFIGWIAALIWAITSRNDSTIIVNNTFANNTGQPYGPPPSYNPPPYPTEPPPRSYSPPPYQTEPSRPVYDTQAPKPTHQTSPTIRRNPPAGSGNTTNAANPGV